MIDQNLSSAPHSRQSTHQDGRGDQGRKVGRRRGGSTKADVRGQDEDRRIRQTKASRSTSWSAGGCARCCQPQVPKLSWAGLRSDLHLGGTYWNKLVLGRSQLWTPSYRRNILALTVLLTRLAKRDENIVRCFIGISPGGLEPKYYSVSIIALISNKLHRKSYYCACLGSRPVALQRSPRRSSLAQP